VSAGSRFIAVSGRDLRGRSFPAWVVAHLAPFYPAAYIGAAREPMRDPIDEKRKAR
jgi:hypothetical protein